MRLGLISDIHGCVTALDAALAALDADGVDEIWCLGDVAAGGPSPGAVIDRLADRACPGVMGNTDEGLVDVPDWWHDPGSIGIPEEAHPGIECSVWASEVITDAQRERLAALPPTATVDLGHGVELLAFHGSPRSNTDYVTATTPDDDLVEMFDGARQQVLAGGHTHVQLVRRVGEQTLVNAGSVGMPFASYGIGGTVGVLGHAAFGVITTSPTGMAIELRQVAVDADAVVTEVAASGMPNAEWWLGLRSLSADAAS